MNGNGEIIRLRLRLRLLRPRPDGAAIDHLSLLSRSDVLYIRYRGLYTFAFAFAWFTQWERLRPPLEKCNWDLPSSTKGSHLFQFNIKLCKLYASYQCYEVSGKMVSPYLRKPCLTVESFARLPCSSNELEGDIRRRWTSGV